MPVRNIDGDLVYGQPSCLGLVLSLFPGGFTLVMVAFQTESFLNFIKEKLMPFFCGVCINPPPDEVLIVFPSVVAAGSIFLFGKGFFNHLEKVGDPYPEE